MSKCFFSSNMKAAKVALTWVERGDSPVCFECRTASELCTVAAEICVQNCLVYKINQKEFIVTNRSHNNRKQAGAELCQAQGKLRL